MLWAFVARRPGELGPEEVLAVEERLNATIDRLVTECVVAYFDRATSELAHQARHDQLTGLLHHQAFVRELELELERATRYGHGVSLVFLDLDRFKEVNDTLGHPAGDRVLQRLGALLRESLRGSDLAGRMGGDEFAAYLVEADEEAGPRLARPPERPRGRARRQRRAAGAVRVQRRLRALPGRGRGRGRALPPRRPAALRVEARQRGLKVGRQRRFHLDRAPR